MMRSWIARLSFSFFIIGIVLVWEAYRAVQGQLGPVASWQVTLFLVAAAASFAMGFLGVRERHKPFDDN